MSEIDPGKQDAALSKAEIERVCVRNLLESSEERLFFKDSESRFLTVSAGFVKALGGGASIEDLIGKSDFDLFSRSHAVEAFEDEQHIIRTGEAIVGKLERETFHDRPDGWVATTKLALRDDDGEIIGTFGISRDVTEQVEAQQALAYQLHDPVTGLVNRLALMDRLAQALVALERHDGQLALLLIDLDDFKTVNDAVGYEVGDRVLTEIGGRLQRIGRRADTVARFGGDEFVLMCTELRCENDVRLIGDRIMRALRQPLKNGHELTVTGSVAAVTTSVPVADVGELMEQAQLAMRAAKRAGRERFEIYDALRHGLAASTPALVLELRTAIERRELFLLYQPLVNLGDRSLSGVEALVRWRHPDRGILPPVDFIPLAEQHGLFAELDAFVLDEACRQLAVWSAQDGWPAPFTMAVNISGRHLHDPKLVDRVASALERHGVAAGWLCLEITETAMIGELDDAHRVIDALSALGVRIALDDFGTGYSTLAHVQQIRADVLKIDRSFVSQIKGGSRDREIIAAVTAMAHALGMTVVGEGVETPMQRDELSAMACDQAQGYLFAAPVPAEEIARLTLSQSPDAAAARRMTADGPVLPRVPR